MRACVRACVRAYVRACVCLCVWGGYAFLIKLFLVSFVCFLRFVERERGGGRRERERERGACQDTMYVRHTTDYPA